MSPDRDTKANGESAPKVVVVSGLSRNVVAAHLKSIFGHYGDVRKVDLPVYRSSESSSSLPSTMCIESPLTDQQKSFYELLLPSLFNLTPV